jgi:hypothetical protein
MPTNHTLHVQHISTHRHNGWETHSDETVEEGTPHNKRSGGEVSWSEFVGVGLRAWL